jgi:hypothetical protein
VQHGCGAGHSNVDCDLILQYLCHPLVRDGLTTTTITQANMNDMATDTVTGAQAYQQGMHEPYDNYQKCAARTRNKGLFTADQALSQTGSARQTRQQNNENDVHGFECQEERDYYPYWHPSPWRDIAVLTSNTDRCNYFRTHSQNVEGKNECANPQYNNEADCVAAGSQWTYSQPWGTTPPDCFENVFSRDNHLGNIRTGYTSAYSWTIPQLSTLGSAYLNAGGNTANCILRIRYNISSGDYAGWGPVDTGAAMVDSSDNGVISPVRQNPYVGYGKDSNGYEWQLSLALNTNQYGRTFQDRSFMFYISTRPAGIPLEQRIINLNVRGKRGNIVEAYPAVEYDFTPNDLIVNVGDYIHFQWTGCNTNPNYAGEGTQRTDRSNIVQLSGGRDNYPIPFSQQTLFDTPGKAFEMAHLNQYGGTMCTTDSQQSCCWTLTQLQTNANDQDPRNCAKLNGPVQYFDGGPVRMTTTGSYAYYSTRNNNFTNRSQKGYITVESLLPTWGIVLASAGAVGFVGASTLAGLTYYAQTHPQAAIANVFANCKL